MLNQETETPNDENTEQLEQLNADPRQAMMSAIAGRQDQSRARDLGIDLEAPAQAESSDPGEDPEDEQQIEQQDQLAAQMGDEEVITDPGSRKVRVKVDGVERDVTLDEVLRNFQKGSAADRRLEEATQLLNEARQRASGIPEQAAPETGQAPERQSVNLPDDVESHIQKALDAIYTGEHDIAKKAFKEALAQSMGGQKPTQEMGDAEYAKIANRVQQQLEVDTALARIKTDYPEIISNPDVELLTAIKVDSLVAGGKPRATAMLEAADEVYGTLGFKKKGRQEETQSESRDEKLRRKAERDRVPAANANAPTTPDVNTPVSPSALIASIAASRMGQTMTAAR